MKLAGSVDLVSVLDALGKTRPVFHSEADLQHALAWEVHCADPSMVVRLETSLGSAGRLDLLFSRPDIGAHTALELKYMVRAWAGEVNQESFALKNQAAHDNRAYDVVRDIARVERLVQDRLGWNGFVIALSNDPLYWRRPAHGRATNAAAFRLYDGETLSGRCDWGPHTGAGTKKERKDPIELRGSYALNWQPYATVQSGEFRALVIEIQ